MCFLIDILLWFILCIRLLYALQISPDVLFFIGSKRMRFPSVLQGMMIYLFPCLNSTGNCPVWFVHMMCFMSSMLTLISLTLACGGWITWGSCFSLLVFVDHSPCLFWCMCLFYISSDSGKYFMLPLLLAWTILHKNPLLLPLSMLFLLETPPLHGSILSSV